MDILTCVLKIHIVLNNINKSKLLNYCENSNDLINPTATAIPSVSIPTQVKSCKVVLEDISLSCGAAKLQMLYRIKDKTHMTDSHHTTESNFLKNLCLKTPIAWGNSIDERWTELDDKVSIKLHMCTTLPETVSLLQETIYTEAASIFLHFQQKTRRLAGQSQRTKLSIQLSHQKNLLLAQIKSSLPEEQAALTHLLINVKRRNQSLYKGEKTHKCLWLMRKAKNEFKVNSYKAGKNLLDPKCCCSLKGDQETLDQRKSCNLFDKNYDIPLGNLEGLTPEPPFLKKFTKSSFFLQ